MPIQAIVFDLDGTLIDQDGAERDALRRFYDQEAAFPSKPPYAAFLRDWRNEADAYLQLYLDNKMGFEEQRVARIRAVYAKHRVPCPPEEALRLSRAYAALYQAQWRAFEDTRPALESLARRFRLAVITNGDGSQQRAKLEATGLAPYFAHVLVSGEAGVRKPDPSIFRLSEAALGLTPAELAYVGDRLDVDVAGARASGWTAVWLDRKGMPKGGPGEPLLAAERLTHLERLLEPLA